MHSTLAADKPHPRTQNSDVIQTNKLSKNEYKAFPRLPDDLSLRRNTKSAACSLLHTKKHTQSKETTMYISPIFLTLLPLVRATIIGTCSPKTTPMPSLNFMTYPTTLTEIYSCTHNFSNIAPPFFDRTIFSNHEQTLTTLQPFLSKPTSFPYTHVITVKGVLSRTEWVTAGWDVRQTFGNVRQTFLSTVTDVDTVVLETGKAVRAAATTAV